jgi:hypothetical protein
MAAKYGATYTPPPSAGSPSATMGAQYGASYTPPPNSGTPQPTSPATPPPPGADPVNGQPSLAENLNTDLGNRGKQVATAVGRPAQLAAQGGSPLAVTKAVGEAGLNTIGAAAGGVGDAIAEGLKSVTPQPVKDFLAHSIASVIQNNADKPPADIINQIGTAWSALAAKHPQFVTDLGSVFNIAGLLAGTKGAEAAGEAAPAIQEGVQTAVQGAKDALPTIGKSAEDKATQATWDMIKPELTKTEQAQAVTEGRIVSKGPLGTITQVPQGRDLEMIDAAKPYVTGAKNEIEAVSNMQRGIAIEATKLKAGLTDTGAIYSKSQVAGALAKLEPPTMIASDATLNRAYGLVKAKMLSLVGQGGNLGDLLDARKNFDAFIAKQFPNLYNSDTLTPMRSAIKDIRGALNDTIESRLPNGNLPDGTNFRDSLRKQSLLYDAIDNTASKVPKVGSNRVVQWAKAHPTATKIGLTAIGTGAGIEAGKGMLGL